MRFNFTRLHIRIYLGINSKLLFNLVACSYFDWMGRREVGERLDCARLQINLLDDRRRRPSACFYYIYMCICDCIYREKLTRLHAVGIRNAQ